MPRKAPEANDAGSGAGVLFTSIGVAAVTPVPWLGSLSNVIIPKRTKLVKLGMTPSEYWLNWQLLGVVVLYAPYGRVMTAVAGKSVAACPEPAPAFPDPAPCGPTPNPGLAPGKSPGAYTHATGVPLDVSSAMGR